MVRLASSWFRSVTCITIAAALVLAAAPADAQKKKKRRKKPAVTAPVKSAPDAPATAPPSSATGAPKTATPPSSDSESEQKSSEGTAEATASASTSETTDQKNAPAAESPFPLAEVSVGLRGFQRHLSYNDDVRGQLPSYDLNGAPAGRVAVAIYPLRMPSLSVGLVGSFEYAFALGSTFKKPPADQTEGTKYSTSAMQYAVGVRANYWLSGSTLYGGVDYMGQSFAVGLPPPTPTSGSVPDVKYTAIRPNVGARIAVVDSLSVLAGVGYLVVLDAGQILSSSYFAKSRSSVGGVDVNVGVSYAFSPHIELRPMLDYRRYFYKFKPVQDDPYIAGGALDQYIGVSVNAAYIF